MSEVTQILHAIAQGDPSAASQLLPLVYDELRQLAAHKLAQETPGKPLPPPARAHEASPRVVGGAGGPQGGGRGLFSAAAAEAMRRTLVDQARRKLAGKRGGGGRRVPLEEFHR